MKHFIVAACLLSSLLSHAQFFLAADYPRGYFRDPLAIPMSLAANFGELRPNHYHMGLDIRTQHRENLAVFAAADGYVARVQIEPAGFGQAIYIRHRNGYTTVYGHLNKFFPALAAYVSKQQYSRESWQVDLEIPPSLFPVRKGDIIAYSGNTGGSQGPHLHFEIRRTAGDINLNPLLFGLPVPDNTPPAFVRLAWYDRSQGIYEQSPHLLPVRKEPAGASPHSLSVSPGSPATAAWTILPSLLTVPTSRISFALSAFDSQSGSTNPNGIYEADLYMDDQPLIGFQMNNISYDNTRNLNAHIDYKTRAMGGPFLQHLSFLSGYPLPSIYASPAGRPSDGVINLRDQNEHTVRIVIKDTRGNASSLQFQLQYQPPDAVGSAISAASIATTTPTKQASTTPATSARPVHTGASLGKKFYPGMIDGLELPGCAFYLGEKSIYDSVSLTATIMGSPGSGFSLPNGISSVYTIGAPWIPLLEPVLVRIESSRGPRADSLPGAGGGLSLASNIVMVRFNGSQKEVQRLEWLDGWASARFREFGNFQLVEDRTPPVITPLLPLEGANLGKSTRIAFSIKDDLGTLRNFRAELDGAWLCFTNDKGLAYVYKFDEHCRPGKHSLKVSVEDVAGNRTVKEFHFTR